MDDASITSPNNECSNGIIHVLDKVLYPPEDTIANIIKKRKDLRYDMPYLFIFK